MGELLVVLVHNMIYGSVLALLLTLLKGPLIKRYGGVRYFYLSLLPVFAFINPLCFETDGGNIGMHGYFFIGTAARYVDIVILLLSAWLLGFIVQAVRYAIRRRHTVRLLRGVMTPAPEWVVESLALCRGEMKIKKQIKIGIMRGLPSPMTFKVKGVPFIVLPAIDWQDGNKLRLILHHELNHIKHHDILLKEIAHWVNMLYWWNPLSYAMNNNIKEACELCCDQRTIKSAGQKDFTVYRDMLISLSEEAGTKQAYYGAAFMLNSESRAYKRRFLLMKPVPARNLLVCTLIAVLLTLSFITLRNTVYRFQGPSEIMLPLQGEVEFVKRFDTAYDVYLDNELYLVGIPQENVDLIKLINKEK